ncbi:MAG: hypothetical protein ACUVXJ_09705 [Phycisphaerae bacterium]
MTRTYSMLGLLLAAAGVVTLNSARAQGTRPSPDWPAGWMAAWSAPAAELRPLQIVHGVSRDQANPAAMDALKDLGLGGIVCNVSFADYLVSEPNWTTLLKAVDACREVGLLVWIYDEKGYPSGSAGGLVLKENPKFEALALAYDTTKPDPFILRPAYEHTHASNNFHAARRYINLLDMAAVSTFIEKTHGAYWRRGKKHFGTTISAFFTDEPSLMAVNIGQLGEEIRKNVHVDDLVDSTVQPLPSVPWVADFPDSYRERYGQDLMAVRRSLFVGNTDADRQVRRRFWGLIADVCAERYFGQIQNWCRQHRVASSGHILWEENPVCHTALYGNSLKALRRMDIPGLDMLSSWPQTVVHGGWMAAVLPASAAMIEGRRRVMTEVSDFSQNLAGKPPVSLAEMQATAAWQAAFGVTEFTLYYNRAKRPAQEYRAYNDFVGRLNALLREARPEPEVILYYPIYDLWADYLPVAGPLRLETQPEHAQQLVNSFMRMGRHLTTSQMPFLVADHEMLASAEVRDGKLWIRDRAFHTLVLPDGAELPEAASGVVAKFRDAHGRIVRDDMKGEPARFDGEDETGASGRLQPASDRIILGRFNRDGREILLLVNVGPQPYTGELSVRSSGTWWCAEPATGDVKREVVARQGRIAVSLPANASVIFVGPHGNQ